MGDGPTIRSLRVYVLLLVGACLVLFGIILFSIFHTTMPRMLLQAEDSYLNKQHEVVNGLFNNEKRRTFRMTEDVAVWEETVRFAEGAYPDFIDSNWTGAPLLANYRYNFIVFKNRNGDDIHVDFYDYINDVPLSVPEGFTARLNPFARNVLEKNELPTQTPPRLEDLGTGGILFHQGIPYFFVVMPIIKSHGAGNPSGTVTMGCTLDNTFFRHLTHHSGITFSLLSVEESRAAESASVLRESAQTVVSDMRLRDIEGNTIILRLSEPRKIYTEGKEILDRTEVLLVAAMLAFGLILYRIAVRRVLLPIERLNRDIGGIAAGEELVTEKYSRTSEFVSLCSSINHMVRRLNESNISLDVMRSVLNGLDAYLYVSDPETDEILFINEKIMADFDIPGKGVGEICWQALQTGMTGRCPFCPNPTLLQNPEKTLAWEEYNAVTGRYYRNTDRLIAWAGNRRAHLQHSVDITDAKHAETTLKQRLKQQELMSAMSQNFISSEDMPTLINNALRMAGEFMNVSRVLLARRLPAEEKLVFDYEWLNDGQNVPSLKGTVFPLLRDGVLHKAFIQDKAAHVASNDTRRSDMAEMCDPSGLKAFINVPIYVAGNFWGIIGLDDCSAPRVWTESDVHLLKLIASVISGVITRSITEEKLIRMSSIVNSSPQCISYINAAGDFEYFNQGALDILGYTDKEISRSGISAIFDPDTLRHFKEAILPRILYLNKMEFELPVIRKDGETRIMAFSSFTTDYDNIGIGSIASDITEKRRLEKELIAAKEQAERSSLAKGDFLSRMSHEMRTPLNAIIGMTGIARASAAPERKEYCLNKISDASNHLLGVINDILDMSKIEASKFELSLTEFSFEKMLMRVVNVVNFRVEEKAQTLIINVDPNVPWAVVADEQRLAQVIANLMSNAVKFTPEHGTITLSALLLEEADGLCALRIAVTDTGIGIAPENQDKLFSSFEQADGGISRRFGGTGLGLAISKSIIELMGGTIRVESEEGKGATFAFTIKVRRGEKGARSLLTPGVNWDNLRILAVDDAPEVREYFLAFAESTGIVCETAKDGHEACALLERHADNPFNIIFADWKMPGMNGIELTKEVKKAFGAKAVVIMISAGEWHEIETEAKEAGVDRFLPKPLFSSLIVDCINECLGSETLPEQEDNAGPGAGCFAGRRILLAEDIEINREIVISLLQDTGLAIDCAENGAQVWQMFAEAPDRYDMIFMDIHMPEVDGYEGTRRIRALPCPEAGRIPIVAMTANVFREDIERCLAAGMNDHIGKPIDIEQIHAKLKHYLPMMRAAG